MERLAAEAVRQSLARHGGFVAVAVGQRRQCAAMFGAQRLIEFGCDFERRDAQFLVQRLHTATVLLNAAERCPAHA